MGGRSVDLPLFLLGAAMAMESLLPSVSRRRWLGCVLALVFWWHGGFGAGAAVLSPALAPGSCNLKTSASEMSRGKVGDVSRRQRWTATIGGGPVRLRP